MTPRSCPTCCPLWIATLILAAALPSLGSRARADFCNDPADALGRSEADALVNEVFAITPSGETVDFKGDRDYNARLITCNRKRDTNGNDLNALGSSLLSFGSELPAKTIKGKYSYAGLGVLSQLRYAYDLRRQADQWVVTVPIEFHWPDVRMTDMIDLPWELVLQLGLDAPGEICEIGRTVLVPHSPREIAFGFIHGDIDPAQLSTFLSDQDDAGIPPSEAYTSRAAALGTKDYSTIENIIATYDVHFSILEASCRLPRSMVVGGVSVLNHLRLFWAATIAATWNRDQFEIVPRFVNCEPLAGTDTTCPAVSDEEMAAWERDETVWQIHFNLTPGHRASYKRWLFKWNNMHTGVASTTIAHELGHQLGLDDEYSNDANAATHCDNVLAGASAEYIMCNDGSGRNGAKAVYPWIVSRRYEIGRDYQCQEDTDCEEDQFCAQNGLNRNECEARRDEGEACSRQTQCQPEATCHFNPLGMCVTPNSVEMDGHCDRDIQCTTGACSTAGICQCAQDGDCGTNSWCEEGALGIGRNTCRADKREGEACSDEGQCLPAATCHYNPLGLCVTPNSIELGDDCDRDIQCTTGACSTSNVCQCAHDEDCDTGQYCEEGFFGIGQNACRAYKQEGDACSDEGQCLPAATCHYNPLGMCVTPDSIAIGRACERDIQCTTGACNTSGICQCAHDSDCNDGFYCEEGAFGVGQNTCRAYKQEGDSCSDEGQCLPAATCHYNPLGMCVTPSSVGLGGSCDRDIQCDSDKCEDDRCVCADDNDCPGSQQCRTPILGTNHCE